MSRQSICEMDPQNLNRTHGKIVEILDADPLRYCLIVLLFIVFSTGVRANYGMFRKLSIWKSRLGHLDKASLYLIYAGSLSAPVILAQMYALLLWPRRSTNLSTSLEISDIWPLLMEFCSRVSLISKTIITCQIALIR